MYSLLLAQLELQTKSTALADVVIEYGVLISLRRAANRSKRAEEPKINLFRSLLINPATMVGQNDTPQTGTSLVKQVCNQCALRGKSADKGKSHLLCRTSGEHTDDRLLRWNICTEIAFHELYMPTCPQDTHFSAAPSPSLINPVSLLQQERRAGVTRLGWSLSVRHASSLFSPQALRPPRRRVSPPCSRVASSWTS